MMGRPYKKWRAPANKVASGKGGANGALPRARAITNPINPVATTTTTPSPRVYKARAEMCVFCRVRERAASRDYFRYWACDGIFEDKG